jgi:DNA-binding transcriptional regulator YhcF (GntR family)
MPANKSLFQIIAQQLENALLAPHPRSRLASVPALAREFNVSKATMLKALHLLRDRGLLRFSRGSPIVIAGRDERTTPISCAAKRLYEDIELAISQGKLQSGVALEKISTYSAEYALSRSTVGEVFALLQKKGLVHKSGKQRLVGKAPPPAGSGQPKCRSAVMIAVNSLDSWRWYLSHFYSAPLFLNLLWELDKNGFDVLLVTNTPPRASGTVPGGIEDAARFARQLDTRYRGTLIAGDLRGFADWREWMLALGRSGNPVHFFCDEATDFEAIRAVAGVNGCYRCCYNEMATAALAAGALAARGHRRAACFLNCAYKDTAWIGLRLAALTAAGAHRGIEIVPVEQAEPCWRTAGDKERLLLRLPCCAPSDLKSIQAFSECDLPAEQLAALMPSLSAVTRDPSITAIIAPNDDLAAAYYVWLRKMGITPGKELSLLSFDNNYNMLPYPISTIDLGYRTLGYQLAHLFIGDVPVEIGRDGILLSQPHLVDRGSIGAAPP